MANFDHLHSAVPTSALPQDVISQWAARTSDSTDWLYIQDGCVGIDCNPTCPDQLDFVYTSNSWSDKANITVMAILGEIPRVFVVIL